MKINDSFLYLKFQVSLREEGQSGETSQEAGFESPHQKECVVVGCRSRKNSAGSRSGSAQGNRTGSTKKK